MEKKYLSIEEAQQLIPIIRKYVVRLMRINKSLSLLDTIEIEYEDDYKTIVNDVLLNKKFHKLSYDFYSILELLHAKGCFIRDLDKGIVDFYSMIEDREIFLSWKITDNEIKYWYEASLGYESRRPVSMLKNRSESK